MYPRFYKPLKNKSFFLFGPRGTGKTTWLKEQYPEATFINLLDSATFLDLLADPSRLRKRIGDKTKIVIVDEIQRIPELLNDIHSMIEEDKSRVFIMTGSSARKLRRGGANLLAGRALRRNFYPFTIWELGKDFDLKKALKFGLLPLSVESESPQDFLKSYIHTYLKEEVTSEGILKNLDPFIRFLESMSFSQGQIISYSTIARDVGVDPKTIKSYVVLLEDLLLAETLPVFSRRAKRQLITHSKFYFFDTGVFRSLRPRGPLDLDSELDGPALETLFYHHHRALVEALQVDQKLFFWSTKKKQEIDFVSYGPKGLFAFEIKLSTRVQENDLQSLQLFKSDYPESQCFCFYGGTRRYKENHIEIIPFQEGLAELKKLFS